MEVTDTIALAMGSAWASGLNLYATLFILGWMGYSGHMALPPGMEVLSDPMVMAAAGFMYMVEFFADKTPGVDTGWDALHTFIRIPAGAMLAATALGDISPAAEMAGYIIGGGLAASTHITKAGSRVLINTSPEPVSNWGASIGEDLAVLAGLWAALNHPWLFFSGLAVFLILLAWLLPKLWRGIKRVACAIARLFGGCKPRAGDSPTSEPENKLPSSSDKQ